MQFSLPADYSKPTSVTRALMRMGAFQGRAMHWWWTDFINFGDWIGPLLFEWRTGQKPILRNPFGSARGAYFVTAGSLLGLGHSDGEAIVWGSGIQSAQQSIGRLREVHAVRGPLTRQECQRHGIDCPEVYGDPGILIPDVLGVVPAPIEGRLGIVPHYEDHDEIVRRFGDDPTVTIIDVRNSVQKVVGDIAKCSAIASSSLHGIIEAQALGIPTLWIARHDLSAHQRFKYEDYFLSCGDVVPDPHIIGDDDCAAKLRETAMLADRIESSHLKSGLLAACPF